MLNYILSIISLASVAQTQQQEVDYCEIHLKHALCGANGSSVLKNKGMEYFYPHDDSERESILLQLNKLRNFIASGKFSFRGKAVPMVANLYEWEWCDECESAAFNLIQDCNTNPDNIYRYCCNCMNTVRTDLISVNFYEDVYNVRKKNRSLVVQDFISSQIKGKPEMVFNVDCLKNATESCFEHFGLLQLLITAKIVLVGCIYVQCPFRSGYSTNNMLCITNLDYARDMRFRPPNVNGTPCSKCPRASKCSKKYTNLCKCKDIRRCLITPAPLDQKCTDRPEMIDYCAISERHSLCGAHGESSLDDDMFRFPQEYDDEGRSDLLDEFNKIRNKVAKGNVTRGGALFPNAGNMLELHWCAVCERAAFNMIKDCKHCNSDIYRPCCNCMNTGETDLTSFLVGGKYEHIKGTNQTFDPVKFIREQYNKYANNKKDISCTVNNTEECFLDDRFFQHIITASIVQIGCAYVECPWKEGAPFGFSYMLCVTNLNHELDMLNKPPYAVGPPCSLCQESSECSKEYPNLCECSNFRKCFIKPAPISDKCTNRLDERKMQSKNNKTTR